MQAYLQYHAFGDQPPPTPPTSGSSSTTQITAVSPVSTEKLPQIYVSFRPSDPSNPQNWSVLFKTWVLAQICFLTLSLTAASAILSQADKALAEEFGAGSVAVTATTSAFLVGVGLGAMPAAPLSELYGRLPVYAVTMVLATLFEIACALAPSMPALIALRFFAGFFSSAPISNAGGSLNDIGNPVVRTLTLPIFACIGFSGPVLGPVMSGFIADSKLGWRWALWVAAIWHAAVLLLTLLFMPETLGSALLRYKAMQLRKVTGWQGWKAHAEDESLKAATATALGRPFQLLVREPIVQLFVLYLTVLYIVLFGTFTAYPIILARLSVGQIGLTYIPIAVGIYLFLIAAGIHYVRYRRLVHDTARGLTRRGIKDGNVVPEERLVPIMALSILFPASLFWLAWTSTPSHNLWLTIMSGLLFGLGALSIFSGSYQYLIDAYGPFAASALACATLVRYFVSGLVILAYPQMYETLGSEWATTLLAFLACALTPLSFIFYRYGDYVRARCTFTVRP